jgi:hypothetical protein
MKSSLRDVAASPLAHWRRLPLSELADQILQIQRTAAHRHLSVQEWRMLDRMRRRRAALQKELMS